jgi:hypothetical protein
MPRCVAIKTDGEQCGRDCIRGNILGRCRIHINTYEANGPNETSRREKTYQNKKAVRDLTNAFMARHDAAADNRERQIIAQDMNFEVGRLEFELNRQLELLIREQEAEIIRTGVDPDEPHRQRNAQRLLERNRQRAAQQEAEMAAEEALRQRFLNRAVGVVAAGGGPPVAAARPMGELARFAGDNQNVHTTVAVNMTKEVINRILKIPVPDEYKWNSQYCSKTPGEIVVKCRLTPKAAWQMISKYCQDETIYDLEKGIYGKVLDGVWQYVLGMEDSSGIIMSLRQEMEDCIGMCAQGNLTRLCNILAGYMEGVGSQESQSEILGRKIPVVMAIEDARERLHEAIKLLREVGLPRDQWLDWIEPMFEDISEMQESIRVLMST